MPRLNPADLGMHICPICDERIAEIREYDTVMERDGRSETVRGLRHLSCPNCGAESVDDNQSRHNLVCTQIAFGEEPSYVLPEDIRTWRTNIGLTQREAARIFGGGLNAFSKYEIGEIVPSGAMDNLLWLGMRYPGIVCELANRRHLNISFEVAMRCGRITQIIYKTDASATLPLPGMAAPPQHGSAQFALKHWSNVTFSAPVTYEFTYDSNAVAPANDEQYRRQDQQFALG
jgi:putative zinc finger/helix-turn-helix YgiT family protein